MSDAANHAHGPPVGTDPRQPVGQLADRLFRHESGRLRAALLRVLGVGRLDLADDIVQEALLAALQSWRFGGVPENPAAWLMRVSQRKAIDLVRADRSRAASELALRAWSAGGQAGGVAGGGCGSDDDPIRLMFLCAHPMLEISQRVILTLSLVGGLGVAELGRAFLVSASAAEQRLTRAKRSLREAGVEFDLPDADTPHGARLLAERVGAVLETIYLLLNEGHAAHAGDELVRRELVDEARRLPVLLLNSELLPAGMKPEAHGLAALACLVASRLSTRTDEVGGLVLLEDQDRLRWDRGLIAEGMVHLARSSTGDRLSAYGLEAAISACHAAAPAFADTDWGRIISLFDVLERVKPSPVVRLNRAVAVSMRDGADQGLAALDAIPLGGLADRYHLVEAARGSILLRAGRCAEAAESFRRALRLPSAAAEKALIRRRLRDAERGAPRME